MNYNAKNPVKHLRSSLKPTGEEIANRSPRDKLRTGLLQHEIADRLCCSTSTIREMERDRRIPVNRAILTNFNRMWRKTFPSEEVVDSN